MKTKAKVFTFLILILSSCSSTTSHSNLSSDQAILLKPQFEEPKSGITINKKFEVELKYIPKGNCVSIKQDQVTFFISKLLLSNMKAKADKINKWKTESDRQALIYGNRASLLLKKQLKTHGKYGCNIISDPISNEVTYLISRLLRSGQISVVINNKNNSLLNKVTANYRGYEGVFGKISYYSRNTPIIGMLSWWVR